MCQMIYLALFSALYFVMLAIKAQDNALDETRRPKT